jgi:RimJ/RimL family protein N-acetyltransferase
VNPVTLEGRHVRLSPLQESHHAALCEVGLDPALWEWTAAHVGTPEEMRAWIATALRWQEEGAALPFVIESLRDRRIVGSTRFGNMEPAHRRVEVGWTWVARPWQRTAVNTEAKYLMLGHAFESLRCQRVELKTDVLNERSRRAIERIGGVEEGVLRRHVVTSRGRVRDTVYYSILDREWPAVRARLEGMLSRGSG